jgi:MYXO-CTERM domain-containing protein
MAWPTMTRPSLILVAATIAVPAVASAHIHMTSPSGRTTEQKIRHCGLAGSPRANVSTFPPGATITVTWQETIQHDGWFRIAFQHDGDEFQIPPGEAGPCSGGGACRFPQTDYTGMTDPVSGSLIIADRIADGTLSFDVTLPNVECTNCTLQLTQFMTSGHGDYGEDLGESDDIYFQCADLILSASAADAAPGPTPDADPGNPQPDAGGNNNDGASGGCRVGGGSSGILTVLAMVGLLRRRRPRSARRA